ncbi:hypothetical protein SNEBB_001607 [Seison nebaliae]|nr:hypothetical protein SNEBB_001607 [Seison nebaliae]
MNVNDGKETCKIQIPDQHNQMLYKEDTDDETNLYQQNSPSEFPPVRMNNNSPSHILTDTEMAPPNHNLNKVASYEKTYEVLDGDEIFQMMNATITSVQDVINYESRARIRLFLFACKWDRDRLLERYFEDPDRLIKDAQIPSDEIETVEESNEKKMNCLVCWDMFDVDELISLQCNHVFCKDCWKSYLSNSIIQSAFSSVITCPYLKCSSMLEDEQVEQFLNDQVLYEKYVRLIIKAFVSWNRLIKWCTKPDCQYAIILPHLEVKNVKCKCGHEFCFGCGQSIHDPVKCDLLRMWLKKCADDSETFTWITVNTKECPKCRAVIEKNGGCNHMICRNACCKFEFCWVCLGDWGPHGSAWYNCNRYNEDDTKKARKAQDISRAHLQRYLFYCNRYMNHLQSLRLEKKLYDKVNEKEEELQQRAGMSWIEVQFLKHAVDILQFCRRTLMYTYVFAFYLDKNNESQIFEDNQKDVEIVTEQLSGYLERELTEEDLGNIKQKVQDKYRYCQQRIKKLLSHVQEGYEKDYWVYKKDL